MIVFTHHESNITLGWHNGGTGSPYFTQKKDRNWEQHWKSEARSVSSLCTICLQLLLELVECLKRGYFFYCDAQQGEIVYASGRCCFPIGDEKERLSSVSVSAERRRPETLRLPKRRPWSRTSKIIFSFQAAPQLTSPTRRRLASYPSPKLEIYFQMGFWHQSNIVKASVWTVHWEINQMESGIPNYHSYQINLSIRSDNYCESFLTQSK